MQDESTNNDAFDWAQLKLERGWEGLVTYVRHLLKAGQAEDSVREELVRAGIAQEDAGAAIVAARHTQRELPEPGLVLRSGPADYGRVFDSLYQQEAERKQRRRERQERRRKSARLAATEPDPAFALEDLATNAQVTAQSLREMDKRGWFGIVMAVLVFMPLLVILSAILVSIFR